MDDVRLEARGLWTDPNELTTPQGALLEALNVRIKRANVVEPRPGFEGVTVVGPSDPAWNALPWMRSLYVATDDGLWRHLDDGGDIDDDEVLAGGASLVLSQDTARGAAMGRCYYVVTDNGVYRIAEPGAITAVVSGIVRGTMPQVDISPGGTIDDGDHVAIRTLFVDTVNGQLLVGAPSEPFVFLNNSGAPRALSIRVPLPPSIVAGMVVQVYMTIPVAAASPTGDEMALVQSRVVTAGNVAAGHVTVITDWEPRGAALYTNETQEGILQANTVPPVAKAIAWFHQMAFYGDISYAGYVLRGQVTLANMTGYTTTFTATSTTGNDTLTGVPSGHGVQAGAYITLATNDKVGTADAALPAFSRVLSTTATTITLDQLATFTGSASFHVYGVLTVGSDEYIVGEVDDYPNDQFGSLQSLAALLDAAGVVSLSVSDYTDPLPLIEWRSDAAFSVSYVGQVLDWGGLYDTTPAAAGTDDANPARLMWSKLDQPEAVPVLNFVDVGDYRQPIMALAPTRDSLFVMKADGVWRVTGDTPETLRVEAYDSTLRILHRRACDTHENAVWAWTSQGIVSITEAGTERVGTPIVNMVSGQAESILDSAFTIGGIFVASCTQQRCVLVGIQEGNEADSATGFVCLYESESGAWTRWEASAYPWRGAAEYSGRIVIVGGDEDAVVGQQGVTRDLLASVSVTASLGDLTYTITGLGGADAVGALVDRGATSAWVTEYVSGDNYRVTSTLTTGAADASYPIPASITWASAPTSGSYVHWRQMRAQMAFLQNVYRVDFGFSSERVPTESTVYVEYDDPATSMQVTPIRMMVSRAQARCARLRPSMSISSALQLWALEGLTLTGEFMRGSERMP